MNIAHVDFETFSKIDLTKVGVYRYAEDPSTEILCIVFAINEETPCLWIPFRFLPRIRHLIREAVAPHIVYFDPICPPLLKNVDQYRAHNVQFEIVIGNSHAGQSIGFPSTEIGQWVCTAAKASYWGLPRALKYVCYHLGTTHQKDDTGRGVMLQLSKPKKPSKSDPTDRYNVIDHTQKFISLYKYNLDDVYAERDVDKRLEDLPKREQYLYRLTHTMNARGVCVDVDTTQKIIRMKDEYKQRLNEACQKLTGFKATQREKIAQWLRNNGCNIPDLTADSVREYLKFEKDKKIRKVLKLRQLHEMKAPEKYVKMILSKCRDERLHGMFLYFGAATGRWSSLIVQLQNLFRGGKIKDVDLLIEFLQYDDLDLLQMIYGDVMYAFSSTVRGMLVADKNKVFRCADYTAIEGRITAWLAGDEKKLTIYRTHGKVYEHTAAQLFSMDDSLDALLVMKEKYPDKRFAGKTSELALGFEGAVGALQRAARKEGVIFTEEYALDIVRRWRRANPKTQRLWNNLAHTAIEAVRHPGAIYKANKILFRVNGDWLQVLLPSGRKLNYYKPEVREGTRGEEVTYMGIDTKTRQYKRVSTFGGRWTENLASGIARDIMANAMIRLHRANYSLNMTVHDEIVSEDDKDFGSLQEMIEMMCDVDDWAKTIPIKADGWTGRRYKKD